MAARRTPRLQRVLRRLQSAWGTVAAPPADTVFAHVCLENVAYLVDDERRLAAFARLRRATRLRPEAVLALPAAELLAICQLGGIHAPLRCARLQQAAQLRLELDAEAELLALPMPCALRTLQRFPAIGRPGAEKILLFAGGVPVLALESNGLRALLRLGYGEELGSYDRSYRSAQAAAAAELPATAPALQRAFLLLRELGRRTCRNRAPECADCPARAACPVGTPGFSPTG